jgi:hypothetical protein
VRIDRWVTDFEHAYLVYDWLLQMMMSLRVGGTVSLWSGDKDVGREVLGVLCERGMHVQEICGKARGI